MATATNTQNMPLLGDTPTSGLPTGNPNAPGGALPVAFTSYNATGSIPNTNPISTTKVTPVVTSQAAQTASQQQQGVVTDLTSSIGQNKAAIAANPQVSIIDALSAKGQPTDFSSRAKLAASLGITNYTGTSGQNAQLIQSLNGANSSTGSSGSSSSGSSNNSQPTNATVISQSTDANGNITKFMSDGTRTVTDPTGKTVTAPTQINPLANNVNGSPVQNSTSQANGDYTVTYQDGTTSIFRADNNGNWTLKSTTGVTPGTTTNTNAASLSPALSQSIVDMQKAYDSYNQTIQQIFQGTFLTPDQQNQIQAVSNTFDQVRTLQTEANRNYEALQNQAGFRGGQNVTDPQQFLAKNQAVISNDLQKIVAIDAAAAKALNDLKQSFLDKNYKMANDAYTNLATFLKTKNDLIQKSVDDANALAKDTRDYNEKIQEHKDALDQHNQDKVSEIQKMAGSNGAPLSIIAAIGKATNETEAMALAGKYLQNPLENAYKQAQIDKIYNDIATSGSTDPAQALAYAQQYASDGKIPVGLPKGTFGTVAQIAKELPKDKYAIVSSATGVKPAGDNTYLNGLSTLTSTIELAKQMKTIDTQIRETSAGDVEKKSELLQQYSQLKDQAIDLLTRARTGAALNLQEQNFYGSLLPNLAKETIGFRTQMSLDNYINNLTSDLKTKASSQGWSIYGVSTVKLPDGKEYTVGDIVKNGDSTGRINSDGSITIIQ